jgi:Transposase DDE domain group 1
MTECNSQRIPFSSLGRRSVSADFAGGSITSDAGALLLREADRRLKLVDFLDAAIPDPRNQQLITHQQSTMLRQRIFGIAMGYEDGNDHQQLRDDPLMQLVTERGIDPDQPLASPPTLCRLENRVSRKTLAEIAKVFVEIFIKSYASAPKELVLDFDATDDAVHGHQVNRFFHGYYDQYCFLPLYVFCGHHLLVSYLRPANIDAARHTWAILSLLVKRFGQVWPGVKIIFRGDSGFCRWKMLRWCERHEVQYIVGLGKNKRLEPLARTAMNQAQELFNKAGDGKPQRVFTEFSYAAGTWDKDRRVIAKAEYLGPPESGKPKENYRFVVTNLTEEGSWLYEKFYCKRGDAENRIKEQQLGLFADRTSCHEFVPNQFRVMLSAAAYMLLQHIRQTALVDTELAEAQVSTIRLKLLKIGGLVKRSARRIVLHLASGCPQQQLFRLIAAKLISVPNTA